MTEYRFAYPTEEADVLDLINAVFSQASRPHDFARLIPKVYAHPGFFRLHAVAVREGRLAGTVAMLPQVVRLSPGGPALQCGYIGSVSVHPRFRGEGHMRALMALQIQEARRRGYDFLALGGQRQRYAYFGFEKGCGAVRFYLNRSNARHALPEDASVRFEEVTGPEHPALSLMAELQERQPYACVRTRERFLDTLRTFGGVPYAVRKGDAWAGYLVKLDTAVEELVLSDENDLKAVLGAWVRREGKCEVPCPGGWSSRLRTLNAFAEAAVQSDSQRILVLNWERVLNACLRDRAEKTPLPEGRRVLQIGDAGRWALETGKDGARAVPAAEKEDLRLTETEAESLLFSPLSSWLAEDPLLRACLPLPLYFPVPDHF